MMRSWSRRTVMQSQSEGVVRYGRGRLEMSYSGDILQVRPVRMQLGPIVFLGWKSYIHFVCRGLEAVL